MEKAVACDEFVSPYEKDGSKNHKDNKFDEPGRGIGSNWGLYQSNKNGDNVYGNGEAKTITATKDKADAGTGRSRPAGKVAVANTG